MNSEPLDSITTWVELVQKFLAKFLEGESFYEKWDRYKEILCKCPHHSLPKWMQAYHFYNGLNGTTRTLLDALDGRVLMRKSEDESYQLLENMDINNCQWPSERATLKKPINMCEVDVFSNLVA